MNLIELLKTKNRCLARFWQVSDRFRLEAAEGRWGGLKAFHEERDAILKAVDLYDGKANEAAAAMQAGERTPELVETLKGLMQERDHTLAQIFKLDAAIVQLIQDERSRVEDELNLSRKGKAIIGKFKSAAGSGPGGRLDGEL